MCVAIVACLAMMSSPQHPSVQMNNYSPASYSHYSTGFCFLLFFKFPFFSIFNPLFVLT